MRFLLPILLLAAACSNGADDPNADDLVDEVLTTFHPTEWMTRTIAQGEVEVRCPVPAEADPIYWDPSREDLQAFLDARLIVVNGAGFEKWVEQASLPASRTVDSAKAFEDRFITYEGGATHSHGGGETHTHEGLDGHTWMDPALARVQAAAIAQAMKEAWPEHAEAFEAGQQEVVDALEALRARMAALEPKLDGVTLLASHPAYNYLARGMGWEIENFDLDPGNRLGRHDLDHLVDHAGERTILLWEGDPLVTSVSELELKGIRSVTFSPGEMIDDAQRAAGEDWPAIMHANLDRLEAALDAWAEG